jgi:hypothetical protein
VRIVAPLVVTLAAVAACSSGSDAGSVDACAEVPVFNSSFAGYESWTSWSFVAPAIGGSPHTSGPAREYLNHKPAHGATSFPVGTIIVKEIGLPPASQDSVFAMVKVGCDYNSGGAVNWEWFELQVDAQSDASIVWHGTAPPPGILYSGDAVTCNACHSTARTNDYVQSVPGCTSDCPLQLSTF